MNIHPVGTELFHADILVRTDMAKLIIAVCSCAKAPTHEWGNNLHASHEFSTLCFFKDI